VEAFHSTLEEAAHADLLLNVCDMASPLAQEQIEVTHALLAELGVKDAPIINVLNKCDLLAQPPEPAGGHTAVISAATGQGLDILLQKIALLLPQGSRRLKLLIPYDKGSLVAEIREQGKIYSEAFAPEGALLDALVDYRLLGRVMEFLSD